MKRVKSILTLLALAAITLSCTKERLIVTPSGNVTTVVKNLSGFNKIDVSSIATVYVTIADTNQNVIVEADDNIQSYVEIKKNNGILEIDLRDNLNIKGDPTLNVYVTAESINDLNADGASSIVILNQLIEPHVGIRLSGASRLIGFLMLDYLNAELSGASNLNIEGSTNQFDIHSSGASLMHGFGFETNVLDANLSGASNVSLQVSEELYVTASGASIVQYKGDGVIVNQQLSGGSKIIKVN